MLLAFSCVPIFASAQSTAPTYYIDSVGGSDSNTGLSEDSPWKTIDHDEWNFVPGTRVLFKCGGVYNVETTLSFSGTKENPIVISSYGNPDDGKPILRTSNHNELLELVDCDYITVSELAITAPNGGGIWIRGEKKESNGITVKNVDFYDIQNFPVHSRDSLGGGAAAARAAIAVNGLWGSGYNYTVNDLTISGCTVQNCANGFSIWGIVHGIPADDIANVEYTFNKNVYVSDCYFNNMDAEAIVVGVCNGAVVTNCTALNVCLGGSEPGADGKTEYYTAAMWFWGSKNSVIEHCEIAGQKNYGDGMTVDFDTDTHYCTYQYIYSHDNMRFVTNNAVAGIPQSGNTVRYCLSVNDNAGTNSLASGSGEVNFKFYNNTIINASQINFQSVYSGYVVNNIFSFKPGYKTHIKESNLTSKTTFSNNCYYMAANPLCDLFSYNTRPEFSGTDLKNPESFKLVKGSALIGSGLEKDGLEQPKYDFYGEEITSVNIGCYGGDGVEGTIEKYTLFDRIVDLFKIVVSSIKIRISESK